MFTLGSLFSGIGGFELGFESTGQFQTIWQSEIDPYASHILKKHWPDVPNLGDVTQIDWSEIECPDMIVGGFPCQSVSIAGKRKGLEDETKTGLWNECERCLRELRPEWALFENVPNLAGWFGAEDGYPDLPADVEGREWRMDITKYQALGRVICDLASCGYDAEWTIISAQSVRAWHLRNRLFILAYPHSQRLVDGVPEINTTEGPYTKSAGPALGGQKDIPNTTSQGRKLRGQRNEIFDPQSGTQILGRCRTRNRNGYWFKDPADMENTGRTLRDAGAEVGSGIRGEHENGETCNNDKRPSERCLSGGDRPVESGLGRVATRISSRVDGYIPRTTDRTVDRRNRLKCLGNAVVPQVAEAIALMILKFYENKR